MKIVINQQVYNELEFYNGATRNEFSGLAAVEIDQKKQIFHIKDAVLLAIGSYAYTEFSAKMVHYAHTHLDGDVRCWFHRHPMGNGIPGPHNWSHTDDTTIESYPLGAVPEILGWSLSIVRTPLGWVGRVDNHIKKTVEHLKVEPVIGVNAIARFAQVWQEFEQMKAAVQASERAANRMTGRRSKKYGSNYLFDKENDFDTETDDEWYERQVRRMNEKKSRHEGSGKQTMFKGFGKQ